MLQIFCTEVKHTAMAQIVFEKKKTADENVCD